MYSCQLRKSVEEVFHKLSKKNPKQLYIIEKKISEILKNPHHYKNFKSIDKSYVLVYSVNEEAKTIIIEDYEHHDNIYKN